MALIKCPECGSMISSKATACPKCGYAVNGTMSNNNYTNNSGSMQSNYPPQQSVQQGYPQQQPYYPPVQSQKEDKASVGLCIISFIIPLVGWILYFVKRDEYPNKAKACSTWAWVGFVLNFIVIISGM